MGLLDAVDGFIARRYGPVTVLGKAMDPFGDALYFVVGAIGSCALGILPLWLAILIVVRYAGPVVLTPIVLLTGRRPELVYTVWGRRNTLLTGIVIFALYWVRLFSGPVDVIALIIALPTLVPTALAALRGPLPARRGIAAGTVTAGQLPRARYRARPGRG